MQWTRRECTFWDHPQVQDAGWLGALVFTALIDLSGKMSFRGEVPHKFTEVAYLARMIGCPPEIVVTGLSDAMRAGLIVRAKDGGVTICGWEKYQSPSTERTRLHRSASRADVVPVVPNVPVVPERAGTTGTLGTVRDVTVQDVPPKDRTESPPTPKPAAPKASPPDGGAPVASATRALQGGKTDGQVQGAVEEAPRDGPQARVVRSIFDHWRERLGHKRAVLDAKRRRLLEGRLRDGWTEAELRRAIDGYAASDWHRGANDRGRAYDDLALICRDAEHVEAGLALATGPPNARDRCSSHGQRWSESCGGCAFARKHLGGEPKEPEPAPANGAVHPGPAWPQRVLAELAEGP